VCGPICTIVAVLEEFVGYISRLTKQAKVMQSQSQPQSSGGFTYASQPHAAPLNKRNKSKYRDPGEGLSPNAPHGLDTSSLHGGSGSAGGTGMNIMNDPRVIRGNTYAPHSRTTTPIFEPDLPPLPPSTQKPKKPPASYTKSLPGQRNKKRNSSVQSQQIILEELVDRPIEVDIDGTSQNLPTRPKSPIFITSKVGTDVATQIESGDLFDFDIEVEPLLEVLVGRTIHVSRLELIQEEENEKIAAAEREFEIIRNIELTELQRLQTEMKRKELEKERRKVQEEKRRREREEQEQRVVARDISRNYLVSVHENLLNELQQEEGGVYDPIRLEIQENVLEGLFDGMKGRVEQHEVAISLLEQLMVDAWDRAMEFQERGDAAREVKREKERKEAAELLAKQKAEEEARRAAEEAARRAEEEAEAGGEGEEEES
jgi:radial spoke head protein 3